MREMSGLTTLRERRVELCDKFLKKCQANERFAGWFPRTTGRRSGRNNGKREEFKELKARCSRLYNSPLFILEGD